MKLGSWVLAAFAKRDCQRGEVTRLDIEVRSKSHVP